MDCKNQTQTELTVTLQELTTAINARNESRAAGMAEQNGGRLAVLKAPPPVAAAGNNKRKGRGAPAAAPK